VREKVTPELASAVEDADADELLDVVVELSNPNGVEAEGDRAAKIAYLKQSFEMQAAPLETWITSLGGEILGDAWINGTIHARIPIRAISVIAEDNSISAVDVSRRLEPDSG